MKMQTASWQAANQTALLAALRTVHVALRRHIGQTEPADDAPQFAPPLDPPAAIDRLTERFALSPFEAAVLLLCAGLELDGRFAEACAAAQGDPRKGYATFSLALAALPDAHWSALSRDRPLRHWRLVEVLPGDTLASAPLRIDERILHLLAGVDSSDEQLDGLIAPMTTASAMSPPGWIADAASLAARALAVPGGRVLLTGHSPADRAMAAAEALRRNGLRPYVLHAADIPSAAAERVALARQWSREARLGDAGLCVQLTDATEARSLLGLLAQIDAPVLVEAAESVVPEGFAAVRVAVPSPSAAERRAVWADCIGPLAARMNGALDAVADQFNLDTPSIRSAATTSVSSQPPSNSSRQYSSNPDKPSARTRRRNRPSTMVFLDGGMRIPL